MSIPCKLSPLGLNGGLPAGYTRLEWIQGSGSSRLIYRNLPQVAAERYVAKAMKNGGGFLWLAYGKNTSGAGIVFQGDHMRFDSWAWGYVRPADYSNTTVYEIDWDIVNDRLLLNGEEIAIEKSEGGTVPVMSGTHIILGQDYGNLSSYVRCYRMTLYGRGGCVFDLVPVLDDVGNPCMYDLENKVTLYNDLTGQFEYPGSEAAAVAAVMTLDLDSKSYAQLTDHGVRRLYHVPKGCSLTVDEYAAQNGFKLLVETPAPLEGYGKPSWRETETQVILDWV